MSGSEPLKPCPFCGCTPEWYYSAGRKVGLALHPSKAGECWLATEEPELEDWNRRAPSPVVAEVVKEMREFRALYGEHFPFDPQVSGFDSVLRDGAGKQEATCRILNRVLNGEWADRLERGE